jgi:dTMP kinase
MREVAFYGAGYPYDQISDLPGKLIVLEGTDGVGRSTQINLLRAWLEHEGYAVSDTGLTRSPLTGPGLDAAKAGHTFSPLTIALFYATDFADRLENQIIPALKAGFIVLSDRYFYASIVRDVVRGADPEWARQLFGFALKPDMVLYLKADVSTIMARIVHGRGFNHWEAGMDIRCSDNLYDSFISYQSSLLDLYDNMATEYGFIVVDANKSINTIYEQLRDHISTLFENQSGENE